MLYKCRIQSNTVKIIYEHSIIFDVRKRGYIIDSLIIMIPAGLVIVFLRESASTFLINLVIGWLYFSLMESSTTQGTLGKMALGLKVTDLTGHRLSFGRATGRYFGKFISVLILDIGFLLAG